jgi:uncharacterized membrane protein YgcG
MRDSLTICKAIRILHDALQAQVIKGVALLVLGLFAGTLPVVAETANTSKATQDFLRPIGYVTDLAQIIEPETERKICNLSAELERKTGVKVIVLTMPDLEGYKIETFAEDLLAYWVKDPQVRRNTILLIDALKEEKFRLELGSALDSILTNQAATRVQKQVLLPSLRAGYKGMAYFLTITELADEIARQKHVTLYRLKGPGYLNPQPAAAALTIPQRQPDTLLPPLWFLPVMMVTLWIGYRETRSLEHKSVKQPVSRHPLNVRKENETRVDLPADRGRGWRWRRTSRL